MTENLIAFRLDCFGERPDSFPGLKSSVAVKNQCGVDFLITREEIRSMDLAAFMDRYGEHYFAALWNLVKAKPDEWFEATTVPSKACKEDSDDSKQQ